MKKTHHSTYFSRAKAGLAAHKTLTAVIAVTVLVGGYEIYHAKANEASNIPQYTLAVARMGNLMQTVSGTGQVSASNQTDIQSQVSGTIESINVNVGQAVHKGDLIATIDPTNALTSLQNAKLALAKLTEPAKATDLSNAQSSLKSAYGSGFDAAATSYLDLPDIMAGLKDLLNGSSGFLTDLRSSYLPPAAATLRDTAAQAYNQAVVEYASSLEEYKGLTRSSSASSLVQMYTDTYNTMKAVADAASKAQTAISYITEAAPTYGSKDAATAAANVNGWASKASSDTTSLLSALNSITTATNSLNNLQAGPDSFDLQSAQATLDQAQRTYAQYFIRAPYDGIIGRIPVSVYSQAGASTAIATLVGVQKIASISLNEVDAAKVSVGQSVNITFDAIDGLNATGTVSVVDQVGTVSQGVVSYGVKILINTQDDRIKPGMSVNTSIITKEDDNVLLVPSTAVKTQGGRSYVQTFDRSVLTSLIPNAAARTGTSTGAYSGSFASSTRSFEAGSTTRSFGGAATGARAAGGMNLTIPSSVPPQNTTVAIGDSDDTNTVIVSGLTPGQVVVTRTSVGGSASTAAPSLFQSIGGNRSGAAAGGARNVRIGG